MLHQNNSSQDRFWSLFSKKLSKEASPEELRELQAILMKNPDLHPTFDMLRQMWQQRPIHNTDGCEAAYMRHIMRYKDEFFVGENHTGFPTLDGDAETKPGFFNSFFSKNKLTVFSFLALIIVATAVIFLFRQKKNTKLLSEPAISSIVTKNGNRTKIVLPDGSQVWLNAGSKLDYNNSVFNKDLREVTLNGEAFFDIAKNGEKPFIIHTTKMDVKVIGTAFNVRSYNDEKIAEASLIRGSIEVTLKERKDQKIILKANEKISIATDKKEQGLSSPEKIATIENNTNPVPEILVKELKANPVNNIIAEIAWTQNKLYFEDESLDDIGHLFERWFGKKVIIENESLKDVHYTGNFENETMEEVLTYLKLSKPFNFRIGNDAVVIY